MSTREQKIEALQAQNIINAEKNGGKLSYDKTIFVVARDRGAKRVLLGGLGGMGVGQMWFEEEGSEKYFGFEDAPEQSES